MFPVLEEQARVEVRPVVRDRLTLRTTVETREEIVERELRGEELAVERVPVGREIAEAPAVREEDGVLIVPVVEEELVVRTRLVLREELHVRLRAVSRTAQVPVRLRREVAQVERTAPDHSTGEEGRGTHGIDE